MPVRLLAVTVDAHDPARVARFWSSVLGRQAVEDDAGVLLPGTDTQVGLRFVPGRSERTGQDRLHLHLTSSSPADQQQVVAAALRLGGRHLDVGQRPEEEHVVLADPEDNAFCVIEPGNAFLAGCGFLAEVACDGTRDVGLFWADALGWPLVWDSDQETAVQSPLGGTKLAWGGPPVPPKDGRSRHRFRLVATDGDVGAEVDRLAALGAARLGDTGDGGVELADPDGNEFEVTVPVRARPRPGHRMVPSDAPHRRVASELTILGVGQALVPDPLPLLPRATPARPASNRASGTRNGEHDT